MREEMNKTKLLTERNLIVINIIIVSYFVVLYLINLFNLNYVLIGVVGEMLTIPFLISQILFLFLGGKYLMKNRNNSFVLKISLVLLAICSVITISSFF